MALGKLLGIVTLVVMLVPVFWGMVDAQPSCPGALTSLTPCLSFSTGNSSTPSTSCCSELADMLQTAPVCLCNVLNGVGAEALGALLNQSLARALPRSCNMQLPPLSQCDGLGAQNTALCFKSAWRAHTRTDSLLSKILVARYGGSPVDLAKKGKNPIVCSWSMRSMIKSASRLQEGVARGFGNGRTIETFKDNWVNGSKPIMKDGARLSISMQVKKAADLLSNNVSWDTPKLFQIFEANTVHEILKIHVPGNNAHDVDYWKLTTDGKYSVKSAYWLLQSRIKPTNSRKEPRREVWGALWKADVQPKDKVFIWRLLWNSIPTGEQLQRRGLIFGTKCALCGEAQETSEHVFRDCEVTRRIWKASPLGLQISDHNKNQNLAEWIGNFLIYFTKVPLGEECPTVSFIGVLKAIWHSRNLCIFQGAKVNPTVIMMDMEKDLANWKRRRKRQEQTSKMTTKDEQQPLLVITKGDQTTALPPTLQTDGSWKWDKRRKRGFAAVGWAIAEEDGQISNVGGTQVYARDPLQTEALAMLHGLRKVEMSIREITINTDSTLLISYLNRVDSSPINVRYILMDILHELQRFNFYVCRKVSRDQVVIAHAQATSVRNLIMM